LLQLLAPTLFEIHPKKAQGPDGFIGKFYKSCWDIIKDDLLKATCQFHSLRPGCWHLLNSANIVILPKNDGASKPGHFRPISLMHSVPKIICKMLANRLAPELELLVSNCRSAFIRRRSIEDNFLYVQNVLKQANSKRMPLLFMKLDIARAFDSVSWPYLLDVPLQEIPPYNNT
jgi:mannosylglycoprotein endo-beta-mannosidase